MKKMIFLLFTFMLLNSIFAQNSGSPDNDIENRNCWCYTIVSDCTGEKLFLDGYVTLNCLYPGDQWKTQRDRPINADGTVCFGPLDDYCGQPSLCMNSGNWEVCDVDGCTIRVFQTVPIDPTLNGQIVGYGNGNPGNSSAYGECYRLNSGPLNTIYSPSVFQLCSGDPAILTLPGMSIPSGSGLCLTVSVKDLDGNLIATEAFGSLFSNGEDVDITSLLTNVGDDIYILEMRMGCCDGSATCTPNTYKYAYFKLRKNFNYTPGVVRYPLGGGSAYFTAPSVVPNGPYLGEAPAFIAFTGYNPQTSTPISVTVNFYKKDCDVLSEYNYTGGGTQTVNPGDSFFGGGVVEDDNTKCWCYEVEVSYSDGCSLGGIGTTTDTYYFRVGPRRCNESRGDEIGLRNIEDFGISIVENPVNDELRFKWYGSNDDSSFDLQIFDVSGRSVIKREIINIGNDMKMHFDVKPGIYFYRIGTIGKIYSGKIIKL